MLPAPAAGPVQAESEERLIELWLAQRPAHTSRAYRADLAAFRAVVPTPIRWATLGELQAFAESLAIGTLSPATQARRLATIKSLFGFAHRLGYIAFDPGRALRKPAIKQVLAERILEESDVVRMIALEGDPRDHCLIRLLYIAGLRRSEACGLRWRDCAKRGSAGQVTVFGKGGKTRAVLLPPSMWRELVGLRGDAPPEAPVFPSRKGGNPLDEATVNRIVSAAAKRAGLPDGVSPHWLRHAHVSHALDRGAAPHLVQQTVGHASLATTSRYSHARPSESSATFLVG
jgi:integrase/recombinase XerD